MIAPPQVVSDLAEPFDCAAVMFTALGIAIGTLLVLWMISFRDRLTCEWCHKRHPKRDPRMTAEEYMRFYCDGWRAINAMDQQGVWKRRKTDYDAK